MTKYTVNIEKEIKKINLTLCLMIGTGLLSNAHLVLTKWAALEPADTELEYLNAINKIALKIAASGCVFNMDQITRILIQIYGDKNIVPEGTFLNDDFVPDDEAIIEAIVRVLKDEDIYDPIEALNPVLRDKIVRDDLLIVPVYEKEQLRFYGCSFVDFEELRKFISLA